MTTGLLEQFLAEEATDHVRREIASAVIEARMNASTAVRTFELNRFELVLRFATEEVEINDVLDASSDGSAQMTLEANQNGRGAGPADELKKRATQLR